MSPPSAARLALSLAALFATLALAGPARAYVRERSEDDKYDIIWPNPRVTLTVRTGNPLPLSVDDFVGAATRAAATWSVPSTDTSIDYTVVTSAEAAADPAFDHENTISFRDSGWNGPMYAANALALTTIWTEGGASVDTDTEINNDEPAYLWAILPDDPAAASSAPDVDLQNALTHELGHVLGLQHPCYLDPPPDPPQLDYQGNPVLSCSDPSLPAAVKDTTMYPSSLPGLIGERKLSSDELLALHDLYPAGRAPVVEGESAMSGGCALAGAPTTGHEVLVVLAGLLAALRRRRARR